MTPRSSSVVASLAPNHVERVSLHSLHRAVTRLGACSTTSGPSWCVQGRMGMSSLDSPDDPHPSRSVPRTAVSQTRTVVGAPERSAPTLGHLGPSTGGTRRRRVVRRGSRCAGPRADQDVRAPNREAPPAPYAIYSASTRRAAARPGWCSRRSAAGRCDTATSTGDASSRRPSRPGWRVSASTICGTPASRCSSRRARIRRRSRNASGTARSR
jgi:hypothetical protein